MKMQLISGQIYRLKTKIRLFPRNGIRTEDQNDTNAFWAKENTSILFLGIEEQFSKEHGGFILENRFLYDNKVVTCSAYADTLPEECFESLI